MSALPTEPWAKLMAKAPMAPWPQESHRGQEADSPKSRCPGLRRGEWLELEDGDRLWAQPAGAPGPAQLLPAGDPRSQFLMVTENLKPHRMVVGTGEADIGHLAWGRALPVGHAGLLHAPPCLTCGTRPGGAGWGRASGQGTPQTASSSG